MNTAITVKDLWFAYEEGLDVLKGVSFSVMKGSYTTILGHNGSGKSTIAKIMAGLLAAKKGEVYIEDTKLDEKTIEHVRRKLGIVFQNPDNQFIASSVREDIAFGLENYRYEPESMDDIIMHYARLVHMEDYLDKEPTALSGGQKQRVAIAGILAMSPEIVIFDEATSMLDPAGKEEIKEIIYELHKDKDLTIISITHDIEEALNSDYVIVMNEGAIYDAGKPSEVFKDASKLSNIGLDVPFTYKVAEAFKEVGINLKHKEDIKGLVEELWQSHSKV